MVTSLIWIHWITNHLRRPTVKFIVSTLTESLTQRERSRLPADQQTLRHESCETLPTVLLIMVVQRETFCFFSLNKLPSDFMLCTKQSWLTDVVVFSPRSELKAQGEGSEELELLWKLEWSVRRVRPVALPTLETLGGVVARGVAIIVDHVEDIALRPLLRHWVFIVRTVDIQVVVNAHINVVVPTMEPGCETEEMVKRLTGIAVPFKTHALQRLFKYKVFFLLMPQHWRHYQG